MRATLHGGANHDTKTVDEAIVAVEVDEKTAKKISKRVREAVLDKGYHRARAVIGRETGNSDRLAPGIDRRSEL